MWTLSSFLARGVRQGQTRDQSRSRSESHGPVVVISGWRKGLNKGGLTLLLRESGVPLQEAFDATNRVLDGQSVTVALAEGADRGAIVQRLNELGAIAS